MTTAAAPPGDGLFAEVAIPLPLGRSFSYRVPASLAGVRPGARVLCDFGRRKQLGVVLAVGPEAPDIPAASVKDLLAVVDPEPVLPAELLSFCVALGDYYFAPIGEVLRLAVPPVERERVRELERQGSLDLGESPGRAKQVGGRPIGYARATDAVEAPGALRGQASAILGLLRAGGDRPVARLQASYKNARGALAKLHRLGLVELYQRPAERAPLFEEPARDAPPELNQAQRAAVARIVASLEGEAGPYLLVGVTGSGKTEVYMHAIARCLEAGKGALVLVPEIALTPQLVGRFRARFGDRVAVLHSALHDADRHEMWKRLRSGDLRVAVGARSALFAPVRELGLLVVDEEHDGSFKQEEGVRYHARDMALLRAHRAGATAVLGSATPSLESIALVRRGKLGRLDLPERATRATLPRTEVIDLRRFGPGPTGDKRISMPLHRAIEATLAAGEQTIVFLNRRGFAPAVLCGGCGVAVTCRMCAVALTFHRRENRLRCHYCDYSAPLPSRCPECQAEALTLEGLGTEKLEDTLAQAFPGARVARLDRDVAGGARSEKILSRVRDGKIDILVGTQMVTKGHDLPNVTLVGVINADAALSMPDFRAAERTFQLLVQVAGRAGRHEREGRVIIQTRQPDHPAVACASRHDVAAFHERELADRREARYPPFARLALLRVDCPDERVARTMAGRIAAEARATPQAGRRLVEVLGPAPAPIPRLRNRFRFRVLLRSAERAPLRAVVTVVRDLDFTKPKTLRVAIDIDPVSML